MPSPTVPDPRALAALALSRTDLDLRPRLEVDRWGTSQTTAEGGACVSLVLHLSPDDVGLLAWLSTRISDLHEAAHVNIETAQSARAKDQERP